MEEKKSEGISNIYSAIGGALLGMAIVDQVTKTIVPVMEKLKSGEPLEQLKLMPGEHEKEDKKEQDSGKNEIAELKRKIEEYEAKAKGQHE